MAHVYIPALLRPATSGKDTVEAAGSTVREVVESLEAEYPGLRGRLVSEGKLLANLAVGIDGDVAVLGLAEAVGPDSEVQFLTAIKGG